MPKKNLTGALSLTDQFNAASANTVLVFDLDNTIVEISSLYDQMERAFARFLAPRLNVSEAVALKEVHSMLGAGYYIQDEALKRHNVPILETLKATYDPALLDFKGLTVDPKLKSVLDAINCPKYILTNAAGYYGRAVIDHLGLRSCFTDVVGTDDLGLTRKPYKACYDAFEQKFGLVGKDIHFFEDTPENLDAAYFYNKWHGHLVEEHRKPPAYPFGTRQPYYIRTRMHSLLDLAK